VTDPRPTQLGATSADIHAAVAASREQPDLFKLYRREWLIVFASESNGAAGFDEASGHFNAKYEGRVFEQDFRVRSTALMPETSPDDVPVYLELFLWNVKGEYKHLRAARKDKRAGDVIVVRNSRAEFDLLDYSKKKLLTGATRGD
jgi:hypothetical protein